MKKLLIWLVDIVVFGSALIGIIAGFAGNALLFKQAVLGVLWFALVSIYFKVDVVYDELKV